MNETGLTDNRTKGRKAAVITAVCLGALIVIAAAVFFIFRDTILVRYSEKLLMKNEYESALETIDSCDSDRADALRKYIKLRKSIDKEYTGLLAEFDITVIEGWQQDTDKVLKHEEYLSDDIVTGAEAISDKLQTIYNIYYELDSVCPEMLSMMSVFSEINRLYTKDDEGLNTAFTVAEEKIKINAWQAELDSVSAFVDRIPGGDSIYLLTYLLKETRGEIEDLNAAMETVLQGGFTETDVVRVSGDGHKLFPSVTNDDGVSLNFIRPDEYVSYVRPAVCRALTESLAVYYRGQ